MILPYILRLFCLCFASFFLIYAALSVAAWLVAPSAIRLGESLKPRFAARLLLVLRLSPVAVAAFVVSALCVPSYLWLEPDANAERVGIACCFAALLGALLWTTCLTRVLRAVFISLRFRRRCERESNATLISNPQAHLLVVDTEGAVLALAGVIRPRVVVSRGVLQSLLPHQLEAAMEHERAHQFSRDNLKRFLLLLAPGIFPLSRGFAAMDRSWARFTEWAADDRAAAGDSQRSLSLAEALVRVARMETSSRTSLFVSCLIEDGRDLFIRVDRLLALETPAENAPRKMRALLAGISLVITGLVIAAMMRPATLYSVHRLLEHLIR
ncbi:MAG TPA: M48 family metalloprotease [Candidatus Acidoferrales bacterium]|nr:M48 family metalloprotease [Candidatus Acidoferrales bacterium]